MAVSDKFRSTVRYRVADGYCGQIVKKLSSWGKPKSTCSIYNTRHDPGLIPCHFIHL